MIISPVLVSSLLVEASSSEVVVVASFVIHLAPGAARIASVGVVLSYGLGEGEFVFQQVVALYDDIDLNRAKGTRLLDWCQFLTELSFSLRMKLVLSLLDCNFW